jgi:triosephosphate isomerase (TIM)
MSRTPLIVGNWKLNTTLPEARALATAVAAVKISGVETVLCPPFLWLAPLAEHLARSGISLGAQDSWPEPAGAFTGSVSAAMLAPLCDWVLVGPSERRTVNSEDDALVGRKLSAVLDAGLAPILCVGETAAQRSGDSAIETVARQFHSALEGPIDERLARIVIAYEPVWAIGSGQAATTQDAESMATLLRGLVAQRSESAAATVRILYGGSVNEGNAAEFLAADNVDGLLVGGASLDAATFNAIRKAAID